MSRQLVWVCWHIHVDGIGITPVFLLGHPVQRATRSCRSETSVGGMRSVAGAIYCASKAAVLSMTKNTAFMYFPDKIRCNAIAPGGIQTEISHSMGMPNMEGYGRVQKILAAAPEMGSPSLNQV